MNKPRDKRSAAVVCVFIAIVVGSMSVVFVKAMHHPDPAQPRAPMHDSK